MKTICVVGTGYVGLVTGTCFADLGNRVICLDINEEKVARLRQGEIPIYEPGLEELVQRNVAAGRLRFTTSYAEAVPEADFCFIAVNTPSGAEGEADLGQVRAAARRSPRTCARGRSSSTRAPSPSARPTGSTTSSSATCPAEKKGLRFGVVSNPEFLREGSAVADFMQSDRVVLGATRHEDAEEVAGLYRPLEVPRADHRPAHGGDDQVRLQRLPGHEDLLHQRGRLHLRAPGRRRARGGRGDGAGRPHRARTSWTPAWAGAGAASPRTSRPWRTWPRSAAATRSCCAR